jgi:hypothetical protein
VSIVFFVPWYSENKIKSVLSSSYADVHFLERKNSWRLSGVPINLVPKLNRDLIKQFDFVLTRFKMATPIFARHYNFMVHQEKFLRECTLATLALSQSFFEHKIDTLYLGYKASHHIDSLMVEIAAELSSLSIFFETNIDKGRAFCIEVFPDGSRDIVNFRESGRVVSPPLDISHGWHPTPLTKGGFPEEHFLRAVIKHSLAQFKSIKHSLAQFKSGLRNVCLFFKNPKFSIRPTEYKRINFYERVKLLYIQKQSLVTLDKFISEDKPVVDVLMGGPKQSDPRALVIFAGFQPEVNSYPLGGSKSNFIDLVIHLRELGFHLPIIFREHPATRNYLRQGGKHSFAGVERSSRFYEILNELGCLFADDSQEMNNSNIVVLTLTGSIAIQRSLVGLNTIVVGNVWFLELPGIHKLSKQNLAKLTRYNSVPEVDIDQVKIYLNGLWNSSSYEYPNETWDPNDFGNYFQKEFPKLIDEILRRRFSQD